MRRLLYLSMALFAFVAANAQTISIEEYIDAYKEIAMKEMIRTGVPASITLAQGIVETENGNSKLVKKSNNHFGIKCKETWTGPSVSHDDDAPGECFRVYNNAEESYIDHSNFLRTRKHYNFLFDLNPADYKAWAYGLKKAGYATNPAYPAMLIKYIEKYNLNEYSLIAITRKTGNEPILAKNEQPVSSTPVTTAVTTVQQQPVATQTVAKSQPEVAAVVKKEEPKKEVVKVAVDYPSGEFRINDTRVVYVAKGTAFLAIAQKYNVQLKWLFDFNDLKEAEQLEKDQLIYLQRKRRTGVDVVHIVTEGETVYDIAQAQGIRLDALLQLNRITVNQQPAVGEKIFLQTPATAVPKLAVTIKEIVLQPATEADEMVMLNKEVIVHVVQPKETLYSISKKYEVSLVQIQQWNKLAGTDLKEGSEIIINK
ncbi:LysM peptidoglycan-binding domain-containing protein [Lacibacter luteus]|uniref:Peptidoglycan hydrolase n=1 Tax=Lacibacter luteus TaxID=2508719 RepID=A0A4Q1CDU3_9BACT|nr:glucosaminidase domain-containing protein [Lacibacter luteus]RXK57522.1 LysM peptidoglycan-binding domain-containing protein [Lacibacter luteus]